MAKVVRISVECTFTKSLPNYENVKPMAGVVIEIEEGDDIQKVYSDAWDMVGREISSQVKLFTENK